MDELLPTDKKALEPITDPRYPGLEALMRKSVFFKHQMDTAKTSLKKDYFEKKLLKNNKKVIRVCGIYNVLKAAEQGKQNEEVIKTMVEEHFEGEI